LRNTNSNIIFKDSLPEVFIGGEQGYPRGLTYSNKHNFAPRFGIAQNIPKMGLVVRAAYGIFFTPVDMNTWCNQRHNVPYVFPETQQADNFTPPAALFTSGLNFGTPVLGNGDLKPTTVSFTAFDPNAPAQYVQQWNTQLEKSFGGNTTLAVGYLGARGFHLQRAHLINNAPPGPGPIGPRRPFKTLSFVNGTVLTPSSDPDAIIQSQTFPVSTINRLEDTAQSWYDAAYVNVRRRYSHGLSFLANYTFAKTLSNAPDFRSPMDEAAIPQNNSNLAAEKGPSCDVRHRLALSSVFDIPAYAAATWTRLLTEHWHFTTIYQVQSGMPLTISVFGDTANSGTVLGENPIRANLTGQPVFGPGTRTAAKWFTDHGDAIEGVRHTLAAGDWPDAARLLADHLFSLTLDGQEGAIAVLLRSFPAGVSAENPELALAHAAVQLAQGRLEEAAAQLALGESHVQSVTPTRRRRLAVAIASLRLALARRSGKFTAAMEQVNLLEASIGDESSEEMGMSSELRAVALMNLGIVETWSGRFEDAERHLSEGAALAEAIGRPYIEVACRAYLAFPSVSLEPARERGRYALALADRYGFGDRPVLASALGAIASIEVWTGEFEEAERWLHRGWEVIRPDIDPAAAVLLHTVTGMLHAGRGEHQAALEALTAAVQAQSLLTGAHILGRVVAEWLAVTQARLGMRDEARATLDGFSAEHDRVDAIDLGRAAISLEEGDPAGALAVLGDVQDMMPPLGFPAYALVEAHVLAGLAHLALGDRNAAAAAAEAALAAAEPDRLMFPFAMYNAADLLAALPRHQTAHSALLADVVDLLRGTPAPRTDRERLPPPEELSASELRVLRYLPTNLTRPEIAQALYVSINTVNTHMRNIYSKLGAHDRSSAVQRARHLGLISTRLSLS